MVITRNRVVIAGCVLAVLIVAAVGFWRWGPFGDEAVPSCAEIGDALPAAVGGTWKVTRPAHDADVGETSALCDLAFTGADTRVAGTATILLVGDSDEQTLRRYVADAPCGGGPDNTGAPAVGYLALRACAQPLTTVDRATVAAAKSSRYVRATVSLPQADGAAEAARDLARKLADHGLTQPAS